MDTMLEFLIVNVRMNRAREPFGDRSRLELPGVFTQMREDSKYGEEEGIHLSLAGLAKCSKEFAKMSFDPSSCKANPAPRIHLACAGCTCSCNCRASDMRSTNADLGPTSTG